MKDPYKYVWIKEKHRSLRKHVVIAMNAGLEIPPGYHVHHLNFDSSDNRIENLAVIEKGAHTKLHHDYRAFQATGDPKKRQCGYCHKYDDISNFKAGVVAGYYHRECRKKWKSIWQKEYLRRINGRDKGGVDAQSTVETDGGGGTEALRASG